MSKKGGTKVEAVDPWEMGRADATFNRIDTYTPFGSLTYGGPNRNMANLSLNPYLADTESRRMMSDRMLMDMALGRQSSMQQQGLPALTETVNPGALNEYFGLPSTLQGGYDQYPTPGNIPNLAGGGKGSQRPTPPAAFNQPPAGIGSKGGQQAAPPGGNPTYGNQPGTPVWRQGGDAGDWAYSGKPQAQPTGGSKGGPTRGSPRAKGGAAGGGSQSGLDPRAIAANPQGFQEQQQGQRDSLFGGTVGGMIDPETFGQIGSLDQLQDFDLDRGRVEQSFYDRASSLLNPQFDQAEQRKVADLRARGIPRDSEAFEREMANFNRSKGETFGRLANDAVLAGGGEQSRLFGLSSALGDRSMAAQQGLFNMGDLLAQRDIQAQLQNANISQANRATQFNELASLLGLQQVASPGLNNFFAPGNVDMMGAYGLNQQANISNANRNAAQKGGMLGGLGQLGGAAIQAGGFGGLFNPFGGGR